MVNITSEFKDLNVLSKSEVIREIDNKKVSNQKKTKYKINLM